jgi:hypothetical protein
MTSGVGMALACGLAVASGTVSNADGGRHAVAKSGINAAQKTCANRT